MARQTRKAVQDPSSPRKSLRLAPTSDSVPAAAPPKQRRMKIAAHCSRCEGNPLRSQCKHTKAGLEYIFAQEASNILLDATGPQTNGLPSIHCSPRTPMPAVPRSSEPPATSPVGAPEGSPLWQPVQNTIDPSLLSPLPPSTPARTDPPAVDFPATGFTEVPSSVPGDDGFLDHPSPSGPREGSTTPSSRIRASAKRPIYSYVKHVYRGNAKHNIYRKHARPVPITTTTAASKAFLEKMNSLVEMASLALHCEDISIKTGAWLFVGAQHPAATGGAINYCSPRLRRDGGPRAEEFATSFLKLIQKAAEAKRIDTFELQKMVDEQREKGEQMQRELEAVRAEAAERSQELAHFREQFASQRSDQ